MLGTPAAPVLETARLRLRGWRSDDILQYSNLVGDPDTARFITRTGKPYNSSQAWAEVAFFVGHWQMLGYGMFVVEERDSGDFLGRVGALQPPGWPALEVAWALAPSSRGKGFATEAARAAIAWLFRGLGIDRVISVIHPDNHPSQSVAMRLGEDRSNEQFSPFGEICDVWQVTRATWSRLAAAERPSS